MKDLENEMICKLCERNAKTNIEGIKLAYKIAILCAISTVLIFASIIIKFHDPKDGIDIWQPKEGCILMVVGTGPLAVREICKDVN